jgi:hypothetical protein
MRASLRLASILLALTAAACGSDSKATDAAVKIDAHVGPDASVPDANPNPFFCLGQPLPTTAPATVTVSGVTQEIAGTAAAGLGATEVKAFTSEGGAATVTTTSDDNGAYAVTITTGGAPVNGYLSGHHADDGNTKYRDTYLYPPRPLAEDSAQGVLLLLTTAPQGGSLGLLSGIAGVPQQDGNGVIGMVVADCNYNPIAGAVVTSEPAGTVRYDSGSLPSSTATATAADGRAYIFNLTPGTVNVRATVNGMTLRAHDVNARANVVTTTAIQP